MKNMQRKKLEQYIEDIIFNTPPPEVIKKLADFVEKQLAEQSDSHE